MKLKLMSNRTWANRVDGVVGADWRVVGTDIYIIGRPRGYYDVYLIPGDIHYEFAKGSKMIGTGAGFKHAKQIARAAIAKAKGE